MKSRPLCLALACCASSSALLSGCTAKGGGTAVPPIPPSQTHIYVFNAAPAGGSIVSFPIAASGNISPATSISGSLAALDEPLFGAVGSTGTILAPNVKANSVTTYAAGSTGNTGPIDDLNGYATGLGDPTGVAVLPSGDFYVSNARPGSAYYTSVTEYSASSNGDVMPIATIRGSATTLSSPAGVAIDSSASIYVSNGIGSSSGGWIAVFAPNATGNVAPERIIQGAGTGLNGPAGIALDVSNNVYVCNYFGNSITVYASGANGNAVPARTIFGSKTGLNEPAGIAVDSNGFVYAVNRGNSSVTVYTSDASGNAAPLRTISGSRTGLDKPYGLAIY